LVTRCGPWHVQNYYLGHLWYSPLGLPCHQLLFLHPRSLRSSQELHQLTLSLFVCSCLFVPSFGSLSQVLLDDQVSMKLGCMDQYQIQGARLLGLAISAQLQGIDSHLLQWCHRQHWQYNFARPWGFKVSHCLWSLMYPLLPIIFVHIDVISIPAPSHHGSLSFQILHVLLQSSVSIGHD